MFVVFAKAENKPIHIHKYVRKTANANIHHARIVFFLLLCLVKILESKSNITANAQGLILSESAAGSITQKKATLCLSVAASVIRFVPVVAV